MLKNTVDFYLESELDCCNHNDSDMNLQAFVSSSASRVLNGLQTKDAEKTTKSKSK